MPRGFNSGGEPLFVVGLVLAFCMGGCNVCRASRDRGSILGRLGADEDSVGVIGTFEILPDTPTSSVPLTISWGLSFADPGLAKRLFAGENTRPTLVSFLLYGPLASYKFCAFLWFAGSVKARESADIAGLRLHTFCSAVVCWIG